MKKKILISIGILVATISLYSCKKVVNSIFQGTEITSPTIEVVIPPVPQLAVNFGEIPLGNYEQRMNIDSAVRANTGGAFGIAAVTSVKISQYTVSVSNADDADNLSNFESGRVVLTSNSRSTPVEIMNFNLPTTKTTSITQSPSAATAPELLPYIKGGELTYQIFGKARRSTSKPLNMSVSVILKVK
jgi:hypothetical protein